MIQLKDLSPPSDRYPVRRALLSVFDKTGLVELGQALAALDIELLSTGGTARVLREAGLPVTDVADWTGAPEMMDGRVKTLHPLIHGGLLARRNDPEDLAELERHGGAPIDLVVVNLYPFAQTVAQENITDAEAIENIDIGGPTMIRAAAKNFAFVAVATAPADYEGICAELQEHGTTLGQKTRRCLSAQAFAHTAAYDAAIAAYFAQTKPAPTDFPETFHLNLGNHRALRYGENPHQPAGWYGNSEKFFRVLHGKAVSYNNLLDVTAGLALMDEFREADPTCAILKHTNPCGIATADTLETAYRHAFSTDRQSPFGGIVVVNRPLDQAAAEAINEIFTEIIIAPDFEPEVLDFLQKKKNRRLIQSLLPTRADQRPQLRSVIGGILAQTSDAVLPPAPVLREQLNVVTERAPSEAEWADLDFAWRVVKHVKSNAIVYAKGRQTLGIGAGQMSRIDASEIAVMKGKKSGLNFAGSVVASDAFFPFADGVLAAIGAGAQAVIQPGGSIRDDEVIAAANAHNVAMVFTGRRHFRH